jgi:hypothetical protein
LEKGLEIITQAGGVPVLAHPYTGQRSSAVDHQQDRDGIRADYAALVAQGLAGLEIYHRENTEQGKKVLAWVAHELNLIVTGSSDFHGSKKPNALGENLTDETQFHRILDAARGSVPLR